MPPPSHQDTEQSPFARPSPWGRPPLPTMRLGPLPKAPPRPRAAPAPRPSVLTGSAVPAASAPRSSILTGSLIPAGRPAAAVPQKPVAPAEAPLAIQPPPAPAEPEVPPAPEPAVVFAPAPRQVKRKNALPVLVIGGTVAAVAAVVGVLVLTGRDAGERSAPAVATAPVEDFAQTPVAAPKTVETPEAEAVAPTREVALRRETPAPPAAAEAAPTVEPEPVVLDPIPIPIEPPPPPAAPLVLKPYTPPPEPDPEAPMTNQRRPSDD